MKTPYLVYSVFKKSFKVQKISTSNEITIKQVVASDLILFFIEFINTISVQL